MHFQNLPEFMAIPRVEGLVLSPDGRRLIAVVKALAPDRKKFVTALWEVDPGGERQPQRLTRSAAGESSPAFCPDGTLVFVSARPDGEAVAAGQADEDNEIPALW